MLSLFRLCCSILSVALAALLFSVPASAQFSYTNDFSSVPGCGEGAWIARFENGGVYTQGDYCPMGDRVPQDAGSARGNGDYMNFYTNYSDAALVAMQAQINIGGFNPPAEGGYAGNNGEHTFSACVYVPPTADAGAEFDSGVDVGMTVSVGSNSYGSWSGDTVADNEVSLSFASLPRGVWTRQSVTFTAANTHRVDAGFYITHPALNTFQDYPNTAVYIDDMFVGFSADAPEGGCYSGNTSPAPVDTTTIPVLPLWALLGLAGLVGLMGYRRQSA